ncbi:MAG: hypothetical protein ABIB41_04765 [Nitrospirota bacterium]
MIRRKIFVFVLLLGILLLTTDALALEVGEHFGFYDVVLPGATNPWTHSLDNIDDFTPDLNGTEPNLIIDHAMLLLSLNFKPYSNRFGKYGFKASVYLDDLFLGKIYYISFLDHWVMNKHWGRSITDPDLLNKISDKSAKIEIITSRGRLKYVNHSVLLGSGHVGPEPISMALVGAGLVGLPIAVRFRRLLRK